MDIGPLQDPLTRTQIARVPPAAAAAPSGAADTLALARSGSSRRPNWSPDRFLVGANLPWMDYGCDFGANAWQQQGGMATPERRAKLDAMMTKLQADGVNHVRWWMLSDGRAGVKFAPDGTPLGLDAHFFADVDAALECARTHGIKITFSLLDFGWCKPAVMSAGQQVAGHADTIADPAKRKALVDRVITPILNRYGQDPTIEAWEVMNEPEWVTRWMLCLPWKGVPNHAMHDFLKDTVKAVHTRATQPVTVGLASTRGLPFVRDLGLDFYQVHWYDYMERVSPLGKDASKFKLDAPLILGEFPSKSSGQTTAGVLDTVRKSGYAGGFAWSLGATDKYTDGDSARRGVADWARKHEDKLAP